MRTGPMNAESAMLRSKPHVTVLLGFGILVGASSCAAPHTEPAPAPRVAPKVAEQPPKGACDGLSSIEWWDCCLRQQTKDLSCATKTIQSQLKFSCENAPTQSCIVPDAWDCGSLGVVHVSSNGVFEFERSADAWYRGCMTCEGRVE